MIRTQVSLTERQHEYARRRAQETGTSMSAVIRDLLERRRVAEEEDRREKLDRAIHFAKNTPYSDRPDVAVNHDAYLYGE